ncbi:serine-rich adhesin for platelets-like [Indicator indicator]|uniref:serine-rich adhesin for platelets-like n=1 Tax=Indicator indicator TaxID=1002788 RepID=UPI0023DE86FC|nr:serine-rich adhesin for platelets-like [Indicator indicator]
MSMFMKDPGLGKPHQLALCTFLFPSLAHLRRQAECAKTARMQMALPAGKPSSTAANNLYEELGDSTMRGYAQQEQQQLLRPSLLRPEELSMESGIDPGQEYYGQDYYSYEHGYELPQYGSRRRLLSPSGMYDEYGEVVVENDGGYYYSPHGPAADEGMMPGRGPPSRDISQMAGPQVEGRPLDGGMDLRLGPGRAYRTSQGKRRLRGAMHLSRVAVSAHKPMGRSESARSRWKKAKIFPLILQKVKGGRKESSYAKLMSAGKAEEDKSMMIRGSYFQKSTDARPSMRKLNHVLKRISVSRKFQEPLSKGEGEDESKSGVSISITAESEHEDSDQERKRRRYTSEESSSSESEDKDYLKVTLDQDEATESTVDSDEDFGESDEESGSSSSSESGEDSSEEDDDEEDSSSDEDGSLSVSSSTQSSYSKSGTSESSSRRSTERSSTKSRPGSSRGRARRSSQKSSVSSTASGSDRDTSYRKTSGSSYKSKTSSASLEIEDTIEEVSEEDEDEEDVEQEMADNSNKAGAQKSSKAKTAVPEGKGGKAAPHGEGSLDEGTEEADTGTSNREESVSKNESSCLESETSATSKGSKSRSTSGQTATSPDTEKQNSDTTWARKKRIKLIVDPEYETGSTGEDSAPDSSQRNRLSNPSSQANVNGNLYIAQNGSVVRTRRSCLANNLKVTSPVRLGKQFRKLDKLAVTQEESVPLSTLSRGPAAGDKMNTRPCGVSFASSAAGAEGSVAKAGGSRIKSTEEQESLVDGEDSKEPLESHSEHTQSDEEELWMGPWNNLHIPMTKL